MRFTDGYHGVSMMFPLKPIHGLGVTWPITMCFACGHQGLQVGPWVGYMVVTYDEDLYMVDRMCWVVVSLITGSSSSTTVAVRVIPAHAARTVYCSSQDDIGPVPLVPGIQICCPRKSSQLFKKEAPKNPCIWNTNFAQLPSIVRKIWKNPYKRGFQTKSKKLLTYLI